MQYQKASSGHIKLAEISEAINKALGLESTGGLDMEEVGGGYVASSPEDRDPKELAKTSAKRPWAYTGQN